jgi:PadR family transcriptional regulator, regulatory protein PadR
VLTVGLYRIIITIDQIPLLITEANDMQDKEADCGCGNHGHHRGHMGRFGCDHGVSNRFVRPYVMLLLAEQPAHGYELMGRLSEFGIHPGSTDPSVLYRMLRMMEAEGLASSKLDPTGSGPARKVYYLTEEGMEVLGIWAAKLKETATMFGKFAQRYAKLEKEQPAE